MDTKRVSIREIANGVCRLRSLHLRLMQELTPSRHPCFLPSQPNPCLDPSPLPLLSPWVPPSPDRIPPISPTSPSAITPYPLALPPRQRHPDQPRSSVTMSVGAAQWSPYPQLKAVLGPQADRSPLLGRFRRMEKRLEALAARRAFHRLASQMRRLSVTASSGRAQDSA